MRCVHGRQRSQCKDCGGSGICEHGRRRTQCKDCGGSGICEHGRQRSRCKDCGGSGICEHGRQRSRCKDCGGGSVSENARSSGCKRRRDDKELGDISHTIADLLDASLWAEGDNDDLMSFMGVTEPAQPMAYSLPDYGLCVSADLVAGEWL